MPTLRVFRARLAGVRGGVLVVTLCALLAAPAGAAPATQDAAAQVAPPVQDAAVPEEAPKLTPDQLDSLVAPIALYPDPLLAQCLVASTYPIDIVAAQQSVAQNGNLKGDELVKAAEQQEWDPSVQALVSLPEALKLLSENIKWTQDLGDAFLAQQTDVMDAVQRMRVKAKDAGKLETTEQQKVETKVVESKTVIEIQPSSPEVVYVPTYNPRGDLGTTGLPLLPHVLPAVLRGRLDRLRRGNQYRHRNRDLRRLGMGLRLGRQQQHHHQQQQQLRQPSQPSERDQSDRQQQLAAQRPAARRRPLQGPGHGEQVRWRSARRLDAVPTVPGEPAPVTELRPRRRAEQLRPGRLEQLRPRRQPLQSGRESQRSVLGFPGLVRVGRVVLQRQPCEVVELRAARRVDMGGGMRGGGGGGRRR